MTSRTLAGLCLALTLAAGLAAGQAANAEEVRLRLTPDMVTNEAKEGDPSGLVDEQHRIIGPPAGKPDRGWNINSKFSKKYPYSAHIDLGAERNLATLCIFDTHNHGDVVISVGKPGQWTERLTYGCGVYMKWVPLKLDVTTRYVRFTRKKPTAIFTEIAIYEHTAASWKALLAAKAAAAKAKAEREAALKRAMDEMKKRPLVDAGPPFGKLYLIDEIDCGKEAPGHAFAEDPAGNSRVETILGRDCRVIPPAKGECAFITYRIGKMKLLQPGAAYVLAVEYPEDAPRSMVIINTGNETSRGLHTGLAVGDAFHPKYVNNHIESLDVPLSGKWETWSLMFRLHHRFPPRGLVRGRRVPRSLRPEDGFDVTIAQFSARNVPMSKGAAVARIRLYAVTEPERLVQPVRLPPKGLPRRRLFWREEMADGVIGTKSDKLEDRGIDDPLDWYRYKAELMRFLGMNTYTKDLLEFGACQHWDSRPYGGHDWVYFDAKTAHLWAGIVGLMGTYGFDVLPYYEYSGSKGRKGLGFQRRCKPLTRDDAYTHIKWIERANADVTDPDTYEDFKKMLDLTVIRLKGKANFVGAWIRTRSQLPVGFGDTTRKRFADEANKGVAVTRKQLQKDKALYGRYIEWWGDKRRDFLVAIRDHLRKNGLKDAVILNTGCPAEPGVGFGSWTPRMVTDSPDTWRPILKQKGHLTGKEEVINATTVDEVMTKDLYLKGLLSPGLNWGGWEVHHARPADDPRRYRDLDGVMMTHAFNRLYTVASPRTFDAYRTRTGLVVVRHYGLNENMMFDKNDKTKVGYFVVDVERAGPYCMMAEAVAMANGDPTMIGYLVGNNFGRGFPHYVRRFNAAFLALPALPSKVLKGAASDNEVVVRAIDATGHGTYLAVVNVGMTAKKDVAVTLPWQEGPVLDATTGRALPAKMGKLTLSLYPFELRALQLTR